VENEAGFWESGSMILNSEMETTDYTEGTDSEMLTRHVTITHQVNQSIHATP
jgi:hypothetical protein